MPDRLEIWYVGRSCCDEGAYRYLAQSDTSWPYILVGSSSKQEVLSLFPDDNSECLDGSTSGSKKSKWLAIYSGKFKFETNVQNLGLPLFLDDNSRTPGRIDLKFGMWVDHVVMKAPINI